MPSMGLVGALGGLGGAMKDVGMMSMKEAKDVRLEELRSKNNQATNTLSNEQRHSNTTAENEQRHGYRMDEQSKAQEYSLAEMAQGDTLKKGQVEHAAQVEIDSEPSFTQQKDEGGRLTGQVNDRTGEWKNAGTTASRSLGGQLPADAKMIDYLVGNGQEREEATKLVMSRASMSPEEYRRSLITSFAKNGMYEPKEIMSFVDDMMKMSYPEGGAANATDKEPPAPGARQAKDGNWYVEKDGKYFRVD